MNLYISKSLIASASMHNPKLYLKAKEQHFNRLYLVLIIAAVLCIAVGAWVLCEL